jgi:outer membrane lipoprotein SlyB
MGTVSGKAIGALTGAAIDGAICEAISGAIGKEIREAIGKVRQREEKVNATGAKVSTGSKIVKICPIVP